LLSVDALPYNPADVTYALAKRVLCLLRSGDGGALSERVTYTYDANGNLLTSTTTGGSRWTYTCDCWE